MSTNTHPHWLPRSSLRNVKLTNKQLLYIRPVFNRCRGNDGIGTPLDGVTLSGDVISGHRLAIKQLLRRFEFSDIDVTNIIDASHL